MHSTSNDDTAAADELAAFEADLARLEEIVCLLEKGGTTLQESLQLFEEGMTLAKQLQRILEHAELRIEELIERDDGDLETRLFEPAS